MRLIVVVLMLALAGCNSQALVDRLAPKEDVAFAERYFAALSSGDQEEVDKSMDPALLTAENRARLDGLVALIPPGSPRSTRLIASNVFVAKGDRTVSLSFEYEYESSWLVWNAVLFHPGDAATWVRGIHLQPNAESQVAVNAFRLRGKSAVHWAVLTVVVACPIFVLWSLVVAARTPIAEKKWLWLMFIAVGLVRLSFNWTTGQWGVMLFGVQLLGSGFFTAGPAAPVLLQTSLPIGAIVFWVKRKRWLTAAGSAPPRPSDKESPR